MTALGGGAAAAGVRSAAAALESAGPPKKGATPVAIPISAAAVIEGDLDRMFEDMTSRAGVNILMPFIYTHEEHRAGVEKGPFRGGNYATPHMQFYADTGLKYEDLRAPEFPKVDLFERVIPVAQRHGIRTFAWIIEDNHRPLAIAGWEGMYEVDTHGQRAKGHPGGPCNRNPRYRALLRGLMEDYLTSYAVEGIMWGSERQGGMLTALGISQSGAPADPGKVTCFCEFCQAAAKAEGISVDRARKGFLEIEAFARACRSGPAPTDGYFTTFWRILLAYPEVLAWESLWVRGRHELEAELYRHAKSVRPSALVGWHLWHNISFSPFQRAEEDYSVLKQFSDFLRPALYNNSAGERMRAFVDGARSGVFRDLSKEQALQLFYAQLGETGEADYSKLGPEPLSAAYVERETRRAVKGVAGAATQIWPGVDIDVPLSKKDSSRCTPESVGQAVAAAFHGGAEGIILSRNYIEMKPDNLSAAGAAMRGLGLL